MDTDVRIFLSSSTSAILGIVSSLFCSIALFFAQSPVLARQNQSQIAESALQRGKR
jgi:hypothetical protein